MTGWFAATPFWRWLAATTALVHRAWFAPNEPHWERTGPIPGKKPGAKPLARTAPPSAAPTVNPSSTTPNTGGTRMSPRFFGKSRPDVGQMEVNVRGPIFGRTREAIADDVAEFEAVNENGELSANAVRQGIQELAELARYFGEQIDVFAEKSVDAVYLTPGAADAIKQLGSYYAAPAEEVLESGATVDREHEDDVRRLEMDDVRVEAWDYARNRIGY